MGILFEKNDATGSLRVVDEMTIYTAAEQKARLLEHLPDCPELELDLSGVTEIDSAGLQLLLVMKNESERLGHELRIVNHSRPVIDAIELLKLSAHFGDPIVLPSESPRP